MLKSVIPGILETEKGIFIFQVGETCSFFPKKVERFVKNGQGEYIVS